MNDLEAIEQRRARRSYSGTPVDKNMLDQLSNLIERYNDEADLSITLVLDGFLHLILSPKKIILGGGVPHQQKVFTSIYKYLNELINQYVSLPELSEYIVSPGLGDAAGITGALILAKRTL